MGSMLLDIFLIALILVIITDISGFPQDGLTPLLRKITGSKTGTPSKIFTCSFCQTNWAGLFYLIVTGQLSLLSYAIVLLLATMTPVIYAGVMFIKDLFFKLFEWLYTLFNL